MIVVIDSKMAEKRKQEDYEETEAEAVRQTAMEAEDQWEAELSHFTPASRTTGITMCQQGRPCCL